jgi:myosin heavy subunit
MFTMVTSVLHLGNITFEEDDKDASYIPEMAPVDVVAVSFLCNCVQPFVLQIFKEILL